ncbi:MAG: D-alanine--D-alanine ligase [Clostridia bacterium]|nr:D-alanine--D-alanine ligase [Clostridia bacterium]
MKKNQRQRDGKRPQAVSCIKVAVLCGGISPERKVSIKSGKRIAEALRRLGYSVATVDPSVNYAEREMRFYDSHIRLCPCERRASRRKNCHKHGKSQEFTASALSYCQRADVVFMALHGGAGEDGRIAATLECFGIPHTGSDYRGLCISMDKALSKRLMKEAGIPTPEYEFIQRRDSKTHDDTVNPRDLPQVCHFPCVIKPNCGGSSIGVQMAESQAELEAIFSHIPPSNAGIIIEKRIIGREFTVGILNNEPLAVTEIIPKEGFYDYKNKYTKGATEEITPARIDGELESELKRTAVATHKALCLGAYSRIDIIVEAETNQLYVLEANALPGMTETSLLPQGAKALGINFDTLCKKMLTTLR